jgi:hypothetical protein
MVKQVYNKHSVIRRCSSPSPIFSSSLSNFLNSFSYPNKESAHICYFFATCQIGLEFEDGNNETIFIAHIYASFFISL